MLFDDGAGLPLLLHSAARRDGRPGMALSVWLLAVAMKTIPMGTAYAVWTGIGAIGGVAVGIIAFGESASALRIASAALIVAGIVGLKLAAK